MSRFLCTWADGSDGTHAPFICLLLLPTDRCHQHHHPGVIVTKQSQSSKHPGQGDCGKSGWDKGLAVFSQTNQRPESQAEHSLRLLNLCLVCFHGDRHTLKGFFLWFISHLWLSSIHTPLWFSLFLQTDLCCASFLPGTKTKVKDKFYWILSILKNSQWCHVSSLSS